MALDGIVSNLVANVLEALGKAALQEAVSCWAARGDLEKLKDTMILIQARVRDAEQRQEDGSSHAIKEWLRRLKRVLYQADDLFDEVLTRDRQKQWEERRMFGKVGILFSKSGPLYFNVKLAAEIKSIKQQLDRIKSDMSNLNLRVDQPVGESSSMARLIEQRETASAVNIEDVIGRDNDKNNIMEILFDPKYANETLTVIPIVGSGGLGKTTLAQVVFNDEKVKQHFEITQWVYVPEKDDLNAMLKKVFNSFKRGNHDKLTMEEIKQGIRQSIENKKYLIVLDDIWDEGGDRLTDLINLLKCGKQGSKIIVTTRSSVVPRLLNHTIDQPYMLQTLTNDQAWKLFKVLVFKHGEVDNNSPFAKIGKEIVNMCGTFPLAIKVVGGFLRGKDTAEEWLQARNDQQLTKGNDDIMKVLKLSYDHLSPVSKQCFAYCSLFPKGQRAFLQK